MEQQRLLRCDNDGRQTNVAPNTLYEAVLNVSAAALFISVEAGGESRTPPRMEDVLVSQLCLRRGSLSACRAHPQQL